MDPQESTAIKFVILTQDILCAKEINSQEKIILGRISGFSDFFESAERTAELLGLSKRIVERAKRHLEELGYIRVIRNTGRGKAYVATHIKKKKNGSADLPKLGGQTYQNWQTENKDESKDKNSSFNKLKEASEALDVDPEEKPKQYGNAQVNELLADWLDATGFDYKNQKPERYAIAGLIRRHGYERTKALVSLVSTAKRSGDQFAPQIAKPSQLRGKYSKLEALVMWNQKREAKQQAEEAKTDWVRPEYLRPAKLEPEFERSPEEDARITEMMKNCRKTMPFLIRAEERKRQQAEKGSE